MVLGGMESLNACEGEGERDTGNFHELIGGDKVPDDPPNILFPLRVPKTFLFQNVFEKLSTERIGKIMVTVMRTWIVCWRN